ADENDFIYGEHENGGTNTIYVSPVPIPLLAKALETGPGSPHMDPVKDMMAQDEFLGLAALAAPLAGVAAGLLTAGAKFIKSGQKDQEATHE
ncbi:MAG: 4Fe-4S ferredoxin, partial [Desulfobacter sp.]